MVRTAASAVPTKREDAGPGEAAGEDDEDERRAKKLQAMKDNVSWQAVRVRGVRALRATESYSGDPSWLFTLTCWRPARSSCALPCPTLQKAREDHSKVHKAREAEAAKRDAISGESGVTGGAKFLDTMHKEAFSSDATSSVEDRLARNRYWCPKHSTVCYSPPRAPA